MAKITTTSHQAAGALPTMASQFSLLDSLRADAARVAPALHPFSPLTRIILVFADGESLPLPVRTMMQAPRVDEGGDMPSLTTLQKRILKCLNDEGPAPGNVLADRLGYSGPASLHAKGRGGIRQLMESGLIINDEANGYELTAFGSDVADRLP